MYWKRLHILLNLVLMLLDNHQVLHHVKGVSVRLHRNQTLLLAVYLEEAIGVQSHHFSLWSILTPETHMSPTEDRSQRANVTVQLHNIMDFDCQFRLRLRV